MSENRHFVSHDLINVMEWKLILKGDSKLQSVNNRALSTAMVSSGVGYVSVAGVDVELDML